MYHLYHGLWGPGTSVPLVSWFVGTWYKCTTCIMVCRGPCTSVPHVPWLVEAWYECTICIMVCGDLVRVYHLYHGLWGPGMRVPLVSYAELGLTGYVMFRKDRIGRRGGGVILYVKESIQAYEIKLEREAGCDEAVWCKIVSGNSKLTIGLIYRSPNINEEDNTKIKNAIKEVSKGECIIMGDFNHGHIQWNSLESTGIEDQQFLFLIQDSFLTQHVLEPTRGENVLDIVLSSQKELVDNVKIFEPLGNSDHNQIHFDINVKSESKNKKTYKRNFHKGNYKDMRKYLAKLDWNNILMNKTAIECWNILKYEIESIIDKFVPFQKQGKRCRKKHLSKEAIRKIMVKQTMWRVYRRTRKDEDYAKYKEALNAATTEIRQSKRSYEQKLACNINNDSKSFYAYVRSKQNVQDKVGPLEDSAGNIISRVFNGGRPKWLLQFSVYQRRY